MSKSIISKVKAKLKSSKESKKYGHIMIDIETFGTKSNSVICSIAAVEFSMETGDISNRFFNMPVNINSCLRAGLTVDGNTIEWWMKQSDEARKGLFQVAPEGVSFNLEDVLDNFTKWYKTFEPGQQVWGNSARFDLGLMENAYNKLGKSVPWAYYNERDVRTLVAFRPDIKKEMKMEGVEHNAIDDCKHQIKFCSKIWKELNK